MLIEQSDPIGQKARREKPDKSETALVSSPYANEGERTSDLKECSSSTVSESILSHNTVLWTGYHHIL
ncbi:hypothetical protein MHYP_G00282400 [Metynnis hypsauchen]